MENAQEVFHFLEEFSNQKPKTIPPELNEYLAYVARTGDPVYQWPIVKSLFKEKLLNVITDFYDTTLGVEIPPYPNVDPFNYDTMKNSLLERLDSFTAAPFTVQRICELLTYPRKQYNRIDKFMRAIEKNILVVSTREPGVLRHLEAENGEANEPIVNGSDNNSEYNVDVEMEDMSWKDNPEQQQNPEPQPSSSDVHISVDEIEARLKAKKDAPMDTQDKVATKYESVTPPELNTTPDEPVPEVKQTETSSPQPTTSNAVESETPTEAASTSSSANEPLNDVEMKTESSSIPIIPEVKIDDAEMTEKKLNEQKTIIDKVEETANVEKEPPTPEIKTVLETQQATIDESSSDSKEETDSKTISEVSTSSEESSSSDNTDGSSSSPKTDEGHIDVQEDSNLPDTNVDAVMKPSEKQDVSAVSQETIPVIAECDSPKIQTDNYSISDVNSELTQQPADKEVEKVVVEEPEMKEEKLSETPIDEKKIEETKPENTETSNNTTTENKESE